ncbi:MAG: hypothetical protein P1U50_10915 [Parvibaculaceae bacterium]|nr:hypothetical protein [Parvibaculaceae bacterium]
MRSDRVQQPQPLVVDHPQAAAMLALEPDEMKAAGDQELIAYFTKGGKTRPRRYYLIKDLEKFALELRKAKCLQTLLTTSSSGQNIPPTTEKPGKSSLSGPKTRQPKDQTAQVFAFGQVVARPTKE